MTKTWVLWFLLYDLRFDYRFICSFSCLLLRLALAGASTYSCDLSVDGDCGFIHNLVAMIITREFTISVFGESLVLRLYMLLDE